MRILFLIILLATFPSFFISVVYGQTRGNYGYELVETIDVSAYGSFVDISTDGTNLLAIESGSPDRVTVLDTSANLIGSFNAPNTFASAVTFNDNQIVYAYSATDGAGFSTLREIDPATGSTSQPRNSDIGLRVRSLAYDGSQIIAHQSSSIDSAGLATAEIFFLNADTHTLEGSRTLSFQTGATINQGSLSRITWHDNNLFLIADPLGVRETIYQFDSDFNFVSSGRVLGGFTGGASPSGLAFIGDSLYVNNRSTNNILRYRILTVPEPSGAIALLFCMPAICLCRRRRANR